MKQKLLKATTKLNERDWIMGIRMLRRIRVGDELRAFLLSFFGRGNVMLRFVKRSVRQTVSSIHVRAH